MNRNICWFLQVSDSNKMTIDPYKAYILLWKFSVDCVDRFVSRMQFSTGSSLAWRGRFDVTCDTFIAALHSAWAIHLSLLPRLSRLHSVTQLPCQQHPNLPTVKLIWAWYVLKPEQWIECGLQVYKEYLVSKAST